MATNRRGQATQQRIHAAALDALAADGLDLTIDDVAQRAGTTRMTVYRHVGSREELLVTLVLELADLFAEQLQARLDTDEPFPTRLTETFVYVVMAARNSPNIRAVALAAADPTRRWEAIDPDGRVMDEVLDFLRPRFEAGSLEAPFRSPVDETLDWLLRQLQLYLVVTPGDDDDEAHLRREVEQFVLPAVFAVPPAVRARSRRRPRRP